MMIQRLMSLFLCLGVFVGIVLSGCGDAVPTSQPMTFALSYEAVGASFQTESGWSLTLGKASLSVAAIRFHAGDDHVASNRYQPSSPDSLLHLKQWLAWASPIRQAWAHPGHFHKGEVKGELLFGKSFDLLAASSLGQVQAYTGLYGTASLDFGQEGVLVLEGTATKEGQSVSFSINLPLATQKVENISFVKNLDNQSKQASVQIQLKDWFALVDFGTFQDGAPDQASANIIRKAVLASTTYLFSINK